MDIGFRRHRHFIVDDVADRIDVNAAAGDVGGDQGADMALLEVGQSLFALTLALVAMNGCGLNARLFKIFRHAVGAVLGAGEDDDLVKGRIGEHFSQKRTLAARLDEDHLLGDLFDGGGGRSHRHLDRFVQKLVRQLADFFGHGGREEQALTLLGHIGDDLADRAEEAEVKHLVGFIQDQNFGFLEADRALAQVVDQTAGRGHQNIDAGRQGADLRAHLGAAEDHGDIGPIALAVDGEILGDLAGEFTGRRQHQNPATPTRRIATLAREQTVQDGQGEGRRFAGACLGDAQNVMAFHGRRDGLDLDRGRFFVALGGESAQQRFGKAEGGKIGQVYIFLDAPSPRGTQRFRRRRRTGGVQPAPRARANNDVRDEGGSKAGTLQKVPARC